MLAGQDEDTEAKSARVTVHLTVQVSGGSSLHLYWN